MRVGGVRHPVHTRHPVSLMVFPGERTGSSPGLLTTPERETENWAAGYAPVCGVTQPQEML
jgi:hypothetical protein